MPNTASTGIFSLLYAELSARSTWLPNIVSLDFVNDPVESGPYQSQSPSQIRFPNAGPYALTPALKNQVYLEHESRLCDILDTLESMEAADVKEDMEDLVLQELIRINRLKEVEWSSQRNKRGVRGAMVNTGMSFFLLLLL